ncbi:STAS domain-containing protein [Kitasatospora sp. NPDC047058]|uniref:STAS domain-containing protein n=1 Tax=Kitasatospora sp. NPDC047058 TaxID=3155620 RepID=UPI0033D9DF73
MSTTAGTVTAASDPITDSVILSVTRDPVARSTTVRLRGELDAFTTHSLVPALLGLACHDDRELVLDLSAVGFCDSAGACAFLRLDRRLAAGTRLLLQGVRRQPARVLRLLGLHRAVPCDFGSPARP